MVMSIFLRSFIQSFVNIAGMTDQSHIPVPLKASGNLLIENMAPETRDIRLLTAYNIIVET